MVYYDRPIRFLLHTEDYKIVIDTKYKPSYVDYAISKKDARQLSGYSRLKKVRKDLEVSKNELVKCLVIYSNPHTEETTSSTLNFDVLEEDGNYEGFYKLGVSLPRIS